MTEPASAATAAPVPPDDPSRQLTVADPHRAEIRHVSVAGGTYAILLSGADTVGRCCLIDMLVPDGGGPPTHRHDFEEMFPFLEGELKLTFRGKTHTARAGSTVNIPANAPHMFRKTSGAMARIPCLCSPAGIAAVGFPVGRVPHLGAAEGQRRGGRREAEAHGHVLPKYGQK